MLLFLIALLFASPLPKEIKEVPAQIHVYEEEGRSLYPYAIGAAAVTTAAVGGAVYASMYHKNGFKGVFSKFPSSFQEKIGRMIDATGKFGKSRVRNAKTYWRAGKEKASNFWHKIVGTNPKPKDLKTDLEEGSLLFNAARKRLNGVNSL